MSQIIYNNEIINIEFREIEEYWLIKSMKPLIFISQIV